MRSTLSPFTGPVHHTVARYRFGHAKKQSESQRQGASCFIVRLCDKSVRAFRLLGEKSSTMPTTPRAFPGQVSGIAC